MNNKIRKPKTFCKVKHFLWNDNKMPEKLTIYRQRTLYQPSKQNSWLKTALLQQPHRKYQGRG